MAEGKQDAAGTAIKKRAAPTSEVGTARLRIAS